MNYFYAVFPCSVSIEFCFGQLPQMAAIKKKKKLVNFFLFLVSLGQVDFVLVLTSTNHKARNRYPGYGSDWRISVYVYVYSSTNLVASEPREYCVAMRGYSGMQTRFAQQEGNLFAHASKCSFSF